MLYLSEGLGAHNLSLRSATSYNCATFNSLTIRLELASYCIILLGSAWRRKAYYQN